MLPVELQAPPPRDPDAAGALFAKNRALLRGLCTGAVVVAALFLLGYALWFGSVDPFSAGLAIGLEALIALFAVAMRVQLARAQRLYRDGIATVGRVRSVQTSADGEGNAYISVHVEFVDAAGATRAGQVTTIGRARETDRREGDEVAVLYLPDAPKKFAIYTPGLGMVPGVVTA